MAQADICVYTLFSGSEGNSVYVKCGTTEILIDVGVSRKSLEASLSKLGTTLGKIDAIFITHEHIDHVKGLKVITSKLNTPVYMTEESAYALVKDGEPLFFEKNWKKMEINSAYKVGDIEITPFPTLHDSIMSVGFVINCAYGNQKRKIGLATDLGRVTDEVLDAMRGCDSVIIESNHDKTMLTYGKYPYSLKRRILSDFGHLSNDACSEFACALAKSGTKNFLLAHLSQENNIPHVALRQTQQALKEYENLYIEVAQKNIPVPLLIV